MTKIQYILSYIAVTIGSVISLIIYSRSTLQCGGFDSTGVHYNITCTRIGFLISNLDSGIRSWTIMKGYVFIIILTVSLFLLLSHKRGK